MMLEAFVLGTLVGIWRGGRLNRFLSTSVVATWLVLIAAGLQFAAQWLYDAGYSWVMAASDPLYFMSLLLTAVFIWCNRHLPAFGLVGLGVGLNTLVVIANGMRMPVFAAALNAAALNSTTYLQQGHDLTHCLAGATTRLSWLGDWLPLPAPYPFPTVLSPGDVAIAVGLFLFAMKTVTIAPVIKGTSG